MDNEKDTNNGEFRQTDRDPHQEFRFPEQDPKLHTGAKHPFAVGVVAGVICTLIVLLLVGLLTIGIYKQRHSVSTTGDATESSSEDVSNDISNINDVLDTEVKTKIQTLLTYLDYYYYEDIDKQSLINGLYKGIVEGAGDDYTEYYTAEEYEALNQTTSGTYCGIGAVLSQDVKTMITTISHIYPGSPAETAGLKDGDTIISVDDYDASELEVAELVKHIKGEEGSTVHVVVARSGESKELEFDVTRQQIEIPTIDYRLMEQQVGYIQVAEFSEVTATQFEAAIADLKTQGMTSLIVDLRDNPGGTVSSVTKMLDDILPEGTVVYTEDKAGNRQDYTSDAEHYLDMPMAVLINENSASASEIFAGAVKDYNYGTLIGTKSYGKGIVQSIIPFEDGSALKLTTAKYFTPKGNYIHGVGIEPDIELEYEYTGTTDTYDYTADNQVVKAIEVLTTDQE